SAWALACRGLDPAAAGSDLALAWTLRGAPHAYRKRDLTAISFATSPFDEADAAKRIFDASKPLREAGIAILDGLNSIAVTLVDIVTSPMPKGEVSTLLTEAMDEPFLRWCRPCQTTHLY